MTRTSGEFDAAARSPVDRNARLALIVFALVEVVALVLFLVYGDVQWFFLDEWDFLAGREATNARDLFRPHNEHWSTLPILVYRALWWLFGLRTYLPYQAILVVLHLTVAALLRVVMRRAAVGPWIATAAASLFALFGSGDENIVWAFQIGFVASLTLGLVHLLLADHDGRVDGRDWLGLGAGVASLMCSGIGVTMAVVVGLAVLIRRGWRLAVLHVAPLGAGYAAWWLLFARGSHKGAYGSIGAIARFSATGVKATFDAMGQVPGAGLALGVLLVVGLFLAWRHLALVDVCRRAAAPGALLAGTMVFLVISGFGRAAERGPEFARGGRYLHVLAALSLPAVALAADTVVRRWRLLGPPVLVLLLIGVPENTVAISERDQRHPFVLGNREFVLALPRVPLANEVPRQVRPDPQFARDVTIGWLLDGVESGRVPDPGRIEPGLTASAVFRLSLYQSDASAPSAGCRVVDQPVERRLDEDQSLAIRGGPLAVVGPAFDSVTYDPRDGSTLTVVAGPLTVILGPGDPDEPVTVCG